MRGRLVVGKYTFLPPDAPVYPVDGCVSLVSPVPEYVYVPEFWKMVAAIVCVPLPVPMFSEKMVCAFAVNPSNPKIAATINKANCLSGTKHRGVVLTAGCK